MAWKQEQLECQIMKILTQWQNSKSLGEPIMGHPTTSLFAAQCELTSKSDLNLWIQMKVMCWVAPKLPRMDGSRVKITAFPPPFSLRSYRTLQQQKLCTFEFLSEKSKEICRVFNAGCSKILYKKLPAQEFLLFLSLSVPLSRKYCVILSNGWLENSWSILFEGFSNEWFIIFYDFSILGKKSLLSVRCLSFNQQLMARGLELKSWLEFFFLPGLCATLNISYSPYKFPCFSRNHKNHLTSLWRHTWLIRRSTIQLIHNS